MRPCLAPRRPGSAEKAGKTAWPARPGRVDLREAHLRDLIIAGRATPSKIVSHEISLDEAPGAYEKFDQRIDGYTKVLLHPAAL